MAFDMNHPVFRELVENRARELASERLAAAASDLRDVESDNDSLKRDCDALQAKLAQKSADYDRIAALLAAELRLPVTDEPPANVVFLPERPKAGILVFPKDGAA
jgi:hypothetical protein